MPILFRIRRSNNDFSCTADDGPPFFVGRRVPYEDNIGLYNIFGGTRIEKLNFAAADFAGRFGFWATFVEPTAICEGRNFLSLNSYDKAAFTFGFGQFAAHVPNGDFVCYLRAMLALPNAHDYFPNLRLADGRVVRQDGSGAAQALETDQSTAALMKYLNPSLDEVEDSEVVAAAKLIHWTSTTPAARDIQVGQMIATYREFMVRADKRVGIDGRSAAQCCVIADILHQGRGGRMTWPLIDEALKSGRPYDALLGITPRWADRTRKLKQAIGARPEFVGKVWSRTKGDFVAG